MASISMITEQGRPANQGSSDLIIVVTDGQSNAGPSPIIAADYARSLGITVAVATIGPPSAFRPGEVPGMAGNDTSLIFAVEDWNALKNRDSTLVRNLTRMVSC